MDTGHCQHRQWTLVTGDNSQSAGTGEHPWELSDTREQASPGTTEQQTADTSRHLMAVGTSKHPTRHHWALGTAQQLWAPEAALCTGGHQQATADSKYHLTLLGSGHWWAPPEQWIADIS